MKTRSKRLQPSFYEVKHVHIRDCKGRQQGPGKPEEQANGRGDIDLVGYIRALASGGYTGPVNLEIIGAKDSTSRAAASSPRNREAICRRAFKPAAHAEIHSEIYKYRRQPR